MWWHVPYDIPFYGYTSFCLSIHQSLGLSLLLGYYEHCCYECSVLVFSPWVSIMGDCRGKNERKKQTLRGCKAQGQRSKCSTDAAAWRLLSPKGGNAERWGSWSVLSFCVDRFSFLLGMFLGVNCRVIRELCV